MLWPFRRKKPDRVTVVPADQIDPPPLIGRPIPPNIWPDAADPPEAWADVDQAARYEQLMRELIEQKRSTRPSERAERERFRKDWERYKAKKELAEGPQVWQGSTVQIFPKIGAVRNDLVALGEAMVEWRQRHREDVESVGGVDELLSGHYPPMETYIGCINDRTSHAPGWEICPAWVRGSERIADLIGCLEDELPEGLYSYICTPMPD